MKHLISAASDKLFGNDDYKHMFLYYSRSENDICVGKASLHLSDQLEISESSQKFLNIYNAVLSGFKSTGQATETVDQDDAEYDYEEEEEEKVDSVI